MRKVWRIKRKNENIFSKNKRGTFVKDWNGKILNFKTKQSATDVLKEQIPKTTQKYYTITSVYLKR